MRCVHGQLPATVLQWPVPGRSPLRRAHHDLTASSNVSKDTEEETGRDAECLVSLKTYQVILNYVVLKNKVYANHKKNIYGRSQASRTFVLNQGNATARPCLQVSWVLASSLTSLISTDPV